MALHNKQLFPSSYVVDIDSWEYLSTTLFQAILPINQESIDGHLYCFYSYKMPFKPHVSWTKIAKGYALKPYMIPFSCSPSQEHVVWPRMQLIYPISLSQFGACFTDYHFQLPCEGIFKSSALHQHQINYYLTEHGRQCILHQVVPMRPQIKSFYQRPLFLKTLFLHLFSCKQSYEFFELHSLIFHIFSVSYSLEWMCEHMPSCIHYNKGTFHGTIQPLDTLISELYMHRLIQLCRQVHWTIACDKELSHLATDATSLHTIHVPFQVSHEEADVLFHSMMTQ